MPENTISSFNKAIELGVDGIELDVQLTRDKILVVHHDPHLERLTGKKTLISNLSYEELKQINASGTIISNIGFQIIPTLEDVLKIIPRNKIINIEIKSQQLFSEGMETPTIKLIEKFNLIDRAVISSFNPFVLRKIKQINKKVLIAQLLDNEELYSCYYWIYISRPSFIHINIDQISESEIIKFNKIGLPIFAYTVNTINQFKKAKSLKLKGIFTDNPQLFNNM